MFGNRTVPYTVRVRFLEKNAVVWVDNYEVWSGPVDCFNGGNGLPGIIVKGATMELLSFKVTSVDMPVAEESTGEEKVISSDSMSVTMDSSFPRVISYHPGRQDPERPGDSLLCGGAEQQGVQACGHLRVYRQHRPPTT